MNNLIEPLIETLSSGAFLVVWGASAVLSVAVLLYDLRRNNAHLGGLMKLVWALTVLYSGPLGLLGYYYSGRKEIARDTLWRKGFRSVAHCYSGCGAGEIAGLFIAVGLLSWDTLPVAILTFLLAYAAGYTLTALPLIQDGVPAATAYKDAFYSETISIFVMEVVAIGVDIYLAGDATIGEPRFWSSLVVSLSMGLLAAYPVNVLLIRFGVKEGMHNPKHEM
ncbi:MAG: DUF4396 domain-containing protein [Ignavibacteriales bacterium]|nr:DUF4396 domain-containing protein [Ignavibacteriales bacterium]